MNEVIPGILHWQATHPSIGVDVSSYLLTDSGTAIDPILPEGEGADWIGHRVQRSVLTCRHHLRNASELGAPILAHESGLHEFEGADVDVSGFADGDELAPGVRALPFGRICPDDAVLHIALGDGVLVFGDGLMNYGGLGYVPDEHLGEDADAIKADIVEGLIPLLDENFDVLLFSHGAPVASGGKAMLQAFVAERR